MGCGGCDDCPQDAWHLHVTVNRFVGDTDEVVSYVSATGFRLDMERLGYRPVSVFNIVAEIGDGYRELIPTRHFHGSEMKAVEALFIMGHRLKKLGWRPLRLKIEGDHNRVPSGRVLYWETHLKNLESVGLRHVERFPQYYFPSQTSKFMETGELVYTIRSDKIHRVQDLATAAVGPDRKVRIEACVLDTAQEMDDKWIRSS